MVKVNDFALELSEKYGLSQKDASDFIDLMFEVVKEQLSSPDNSVKIKGFGTFKVSAVSARASVDVNTGERIVLDGRNKISFTPEVLLRDRVNKPFVQFETVVLNDGVDFSDIDNEAASSIDEDATTLEKTTPNIEEGTSEPDEAPSETVASSETETPLETVASSETVVSSEVVTTSEDKVPSVNENSSEVVKTSEETVENVGTENHNENSDLEKTPKTVDTTEHREIARKLMADTTANEDVAEESQDADGESSVEVVCRQRSPRLMYVLSLASFLLLVILGVGMYFLYMRVEEKNNVIGRLENRLTMQTDSLRNEKILQRDTAERTVASLPNHTERKDTVAMKKDTTAISAPRTSPSDYNYDVRVRTGAYIIVGVAKTVVVQKGQTLSSISKANLGDGMECYVEVLNNCSKVKPGDKLKIPELKLKPRHN